VAVALVSLFFAAYAWPRRAVAGATPFFIGLVGYAVGALLLALMMMAVALPLKIAFRQAWGLCMLVEAWATLALALDYTGLSAAIPARGWVLLFAPAALIAGLIITAQWNTLFWSRTWFDGSLRAGHTLTQTLAVTYLYALGVAAAVVLLRAFLRSRGVFRWQAGLLILGLGLTWLGEGVDFIRGSLYPVIDASALGTILGWFAFAAALFLFRTFDLAPVARDHLVERMNDGMLVLDLQGRVVDLNPQTRLLLAPLPVEPTGQPMAEALRAWPELLEALRDPPAARATISRGTGSSPEAYTVSTTPITDTRGQPAGRLIILHDVTLLRQHQEEVLQQRQAVAALIERDRLGRELHDGLGQTLSFIQMEAQAARDALSHAQPATADAYLARIVAVAQEAQGDIRAFLVAVRTGTAFERGFFAGLDDYLARYRRQYPFHIALTRPVMLTDAALEPIVQAQLLRIIQESLANVRQHAAATEVRITFRCEADFVCVEIDDNGQGVDPVALHSRQGGHYGLRFMRERAEEVGGTLEFATTPGSGFKVSVRVPARCGAETPNVTGERTAAGGRKGDQP
jgi:signal transduction histidine kinase